MHKLTETNLFKQLIKREKADGFETAEISSVVNKIITDTYPILQQVSRSFPLYTLHDPEHGFRVAENIFQIVPKKTLQQLNSIEISILLYSSYLHDIGMASSTEEFYNWFESEEYKTFINSNERWGNEIRRIEWKYEEKEWNLKNVKSKVKKPTKKKINPTDQVELRRMQDIVYTEYLRLNHAERGANYVLNNFGQDGTSDSKIQIKQVNYAEYVALVCKSHWENTTALKEEEFRRDIHINKFPVNIQYCSVLLRLADLIDLDPERTPKVLMDFIFSDLHKKDNKSTTIKKNEKLSADEWSKHRAVLGYKITPEEIRIEAKCSHPAIQRGLIDWCIYIDTERRNCRLIVQDNVKEISEKYQLDLVNEIRTDFIKSNGSYIYTDFKFQLDYDRIVNMLMGTELWGDEMVVFRELLQNAIDACNHRKALCQKVNVPYTPEIIFSITHDDNNGHSILKCSDNGIGMNQHIIENYLMCVGRSYYTSNEFKSRNLELYPISQFGLGLMSCFMMTNKVKVETRYLNEYLEMQKALSVEIDSAGKYVVLRSTNRNMEGTSVSLIFDRIDYHKRRRMHKEKFDHFEKDFYHFGEWDYILHHYAVHIDIPIKVIYDYGNTKERRSKIIENRPFYIPEINWNNYPGMEETHKEFVFKYDYLETDGLAGIFRFLIPVDSSGNLSFVTLIDNKFKVSINDHGDLCFTTPKFENKKLRFDIKVDEKYDWGTEEIRGVYRNKYDLKPQGSSYEGLLEKISSNFIWSQDGLRIDLLDSHYQRKRNGSNDEDKTNIFKFIPVPGLNATEFDLRGEWRTSLNVQRTDFVRNESFDSFINRYYLLAADMWLKIVSDNKSFTDTEVKKQFINTLVELADWKLKTHLKNVLKIKEVPILKQPDGMKKK
jgi:hypothetical protein